MAGLRKTRPSKAVIYARVSGTKQVREGDGLASQENRCREYATYKDYDVVEVFQDDMSGKFERRPAMDRMLAFLRLHPKDSVVVIIDDISRFARNVQAHIKLRETLSDAGGILESPSIEFGEDSDSRLVEHMLASVAQHQREKNAEQTSNRMKGRMMNGYSVFSAPVGYKYKKTGSQHKELDKQQDALVERMVETSNPKVMAALENKIAKLEEDKILLTDKLSQNTKPKSTLGEIIELLRACLANPWNIYENGTLEVRKTILKTAFASPLAYDRKNGYRTPQVSVIFEFFEKITSKCEMVPPHGLEPRTY